MGSEGYSNADGEVSKAANCGSERKSARARYCLAKKILGAIAMS